MVLRRLKNTILIEARLWNQTETICGVGMKSKNIVFVHGTFGWGSSEMAGFNYWGEALELDPGEFVAHEASCGPVSSFHDRACEVAAQIAGARTDYGKEHSDREGHRRFSGDYTGKGFVSDWSEDNPIILVGHSAGGHTCLMLQQLLADDFWGWGSNARWVEAVVSISGVLNGSTLPYMLGCDMKTGLLDGSVGWFINGAVQVIALATGGDIGGLYDFDLDQWIGDGYGQDLDRMVETLEGSRFGEGEDNIAFDLTLQGVYKANKGFSTDPDTYYLSVVTEQTSNGFPDFAMNPALMASAFYQGQIVSFDEAPVPGWGSGDLVMGKWRENDGAVSAISQRYPFTAGDHPVGGEGFMSTPVERGAWYFETAHTITGRHFDHLDVAFGYHSDLTLLDAHRQLYEKLYALLNRLP